MNFWGFRLYLFALLGALRVDAASLPGQLSPTEVDRVVEVVAVGATTRLLRSAEPYVLFPGLKVGLEIAIVPSRDLNDMGDRLGSLPTAMPVPRVFFSKGLFLNLELMFNFFPFSLVNSISTFGGALKWTFFQETKSWLNGAAYIAFTNISAFEKTFTGGTVELGALLSKDYVRLKPYLGFGLIFARGSVTSSLARTTDNTGAYSTLHAFVGAEIEMPVNLGFQLDMFNLAPAGTLFVGKKF